MQQAKTIKKKSIRKLFKYLTITITITIEQGIFYCQINCHLRYAEINVGNSITQNKYILQNIQIQTLRQVFQNIIIVQQKMNEQPKLINQKNKKQVTKFSRQTQSKLSNPASLKNNLLIVPQLNLMKIKTPNKQGNPSKQQQNLNSYKRLETKQTIEGLTSNRQADLGAGYFKPNVQVSPTISNRYMHSPIQSLLKSRKSKVDSDSFNTEADKQQILLLEIKQLKQQNTFLKKKIRDLKKQLNGGFLPEDYQRKSPNNKQNPAKRQKKGFPKVNIESLHLSVNLFFQEIKNLLNSVTQLFRIQFTQDQIQQFQQKHSEKEIVDELNEEICPLRRHEILKKFYLRRKLDRLAFEEEQKRYEFLLTIFSEYYTFKQESQKKVVDTLDHMIMYTSDLNKWLIEKAYAKRMKSQIQSQKNTQRQSITPVSPPKFDSSKLPPHTFNYVNKARGHTLSPDNKIKETH